MTDIIVTWPKTRPLGSYYAELENAKRLGRVINFRIPTRPRATPRRCYMVYDGAVRCWSSVIEVVYRNAGEVRKVASDPGVVEWGFWPAGWYVVRDPVYHELADHGIPMRGFQGFRYYEGDR
jgi:hypothetical protein